MNSGSTVPPRGGRKHYLYLLSGLVGLISLAGQAWAETASLVVDSAAGTGARGALFSVDSTGTRTLLSDFGDATQGPLGTNPIQVALGTSGEIVVVDFDAGLDAKGALFRVDAASGNRALVSDFGDASKGPLGEDPVNLTIDASGTILVVDLDAGANFEGALFSVNASTGNRTILSNFNNAAQGPGELPLGVALGPSGEILAIVLQAGANSSGALLKVNATTGSRTVVSDFGDASQGPLGVIPFGLTLGPSDEILVVDEDAGTGLRGALFSVNLSNGIRTLVSDFGDDSQGTTGEDPVNLAVDSAGEVLVVDFSYGTDLRGALFSVDLTNGSRTRLSNFSNTLQGPLGEDPFGVAFVPPPGPGVLEFSTANYSVSEIAGSATITVTRTGGSDGTASVNYVTSGGTATDGADYGFTSGSLTFADGDAASQTFTVPIIDDSDNELDETVHLTLSNPVGGATLGATDTAVLTIADNDDAPQVTCAGLAATIVGTADSDTLVGTAGRDVIHGLEGNDVIRGLAGPDIVCGGLGADQLFGGRHDDQLLGGSGNDQLFGDRGNDQLFGERDNDRLDGGDDSDRCDGGPHSTRDRAANCEQVRNVP